MANDMGIVDLQLVKEVEVVKGKVNDVVEVFDPLARAEPRMGRGVDGEVFGQFVKERGSNHRPASPVQEEEWRSAPPPLHSCDKLPVPYGYPQFLHATISLHLIAECGFRTFHHSAPSVPSSDSRP